MIHGNERLKVAEKARRLGVREHYGGVVSDNTHSINRRMILENIKVSRGTGRGLRVKGGRASSLSGRDCRYLCCRG